MTNGKEIAAKSAAAKTVAAKTAEDTKAAAKSAVKTEVKAEPVKAAAVKAEVKTETVKAEPAKVEAAKAEPAKTEAAPVKEESADKKAGRKPGSKSKAVKPAKAAKKEEVEAEIYVQFGPGESSVQAVVEKIKAEFVEQGHRASSIKNLKVYLKPEERSAYYVINDNKYTGRVDMF